MGLLGFDVGVKKVGNKDNKLSEKNEETTEHIEIIPEHIEVNQSENTGLNIETIPEQKNLIVKAKALNNFDDVSEKEEGTESKREKVIYNNPLSEKQNEVSEKEDIVKVPIAFDKWYQAQNHNLSVRKAFKKIDELENENQEVYQWVEENEDTFAEIWLGNLAYKVKAIPVYETTLPNEGKRPNILVKEADGAILLKPYALLDDDNDVTELTEEEIMKDWSFLFQNGYSHLLNAEEI